MDDLATHLKELEEKLFEPSVRASREMVTALLSRDFREIGSSGRLYTFDVIVPALLAEQRTGTSRGEHFETQRLAEHIALVTYRAIYTDPDGSERRTLRSSIWRLEEDGHWRMLFHQGTVAGEASGALQEELTPAMRAPNSEFITVTAEEVIRRNKRR